MCVSVYPVLLLALTILHGCVADKQHHGYQRNQEESLPGQPVTLWTRPHSNSITVAWTAAEGHAHVTGYRIGWGNVVDEYIVTLADNQRYYNIRNLEPNTFYFISVRAINDMGLGQARYVGETTLQASTETPPGPVQSLAAVANIDSIVVTWRPPLEEDHLFGYVITWSIGIEEQAKLLLDRSQLSWKIESLDPATVYFIGVKAIYTEGTGPIEQVEVSTLPVS